MLAALRGDDPDALRAALVALEAGDAPVDVPVCAALIELLGHAAKEVRRRAAGALALAVVDPACRAALERALTDAAPERRWGAAFALARAGIADDAVVGAALAALGAVDGDVRWAAAEIVCAAARGRAEVSRALAQACNSPVAEQRKMALYCLRDLGTAEFAPFVDALSDDDRGVRLAGLAGLARYDTLAADAMERVLACMRGDADAGVRRAAAATAAKLARHDPAVARALEEAVGKSDDRDFLRAAARRRPRGRSR